MPPEIVSIVAEVPIEVAQKLGIAARDRAKRFEAFNGRILTTVIEENLLKAVLDEET